MKNKNFDYFYIAISVFVNKNIFDEFVSETQKGVVDKIVAWANKKAIIQSKGAEGLNELKEYISNNCLNKSKTTIFSENYTFKDLLNRFELPVSKLCESINEHWCIPFGFEPLNQPMFTRLSQKFDPKTAKQKNLLRGLAFYLTCNYPDQKISYLSLINLSTAPAVKFEKDQGARVMFSFQGLGDKGRALDWLMAEIEKIIKNILLIAYPSKPTLSEENIIITLPVAKTESKRDIGSPHFYAISVRDALCLCHQVMVTWSLSEEYSAYPFFPVCAISAGDYISKGDETLKDVVTEDIPGESNIRLTQFARLCVKMASLKVLFRKQYYEIELKRPYKSKTIWVIRNYWTHIYWPHNRDLLKRYMLPLNDPDQRSNRDEIAEFRELISYPKPDKTFDALTKKYKAIGQLFQFSRNTFLYLEIAKILFYRKMFHEARSILNYAISANSRNMVARSMKMMIYTNLALAPGESHDTAEKFFCLSENEFKYITKYCKVDEDGYCEYGLIKFAKALRGLLVFIDKEKISDKSALFNYIKDNISKSMDAFWQGYTVSVTGHRSLFWLICTETFQKAVEEVIASLEITQNSIYDSMGKLSRKIGLNLLIIFGLLDQDFVKTIAPDGNIEKGLKWLDNISENASKVSLSDIEERKRFEICQTMLINYKKELLRAIQIYENSVLLSSYIPEVKFAFAVIAWDYSVIMTSEIAEQVFRWLEEAKATAEKLVEHNLGVYTKLRRDGFIQRPKNFISLINSITKEMKKTIGKDLNKPSSGKNIIPHSKIEKINIFSRYLLTTIDEVKP